MGAEISCMMKYEGKSHEGKALLETSELIFRGDRTLKIPFNTIHSVRASKGMLKVGFRDGVASFEIKDKAGIWRYKILHPKSRLEKLGVKEDFRIGVDGVEDEGFLDQLREKATGGVSKGLQKESDLIFCGVESRKDLTRLKEVKRYLKKNGSLWIIFLKGKAAIVKEVEVMAAGKKAGLVDTKVVGFSETHTALKFMIPLSRR
jgi:hypothetical protein